MCKTLKGLWIALFLIGAQSKRLVVRKEGIQILPLIVEMKNFDTTKHDLNTIGSYFSYSALLGFLTSVKLPKKIAARFITDSIKPLPENGTSKRWVIVKIELSEKDFAAIANNGGNFIPMEIKEIGEIIKKIKDNRKKEKNISENEFDFDKLFSKKDENIYRVDDTHIKLIETFLGSFKGHLGDGDFFCLLLQNFYVNLGH